MTLLPQTHAQLQQQTYLPKADLRLSVTSEDALKFLATFNRFALAWGFAGKHDLNGMPLRDGRRFTYLVFERSDGAEIRVTDILRSGEFSVLFYDRQDAGNIKAVIDRFLVEFSQWSRAGSLPAGM